MNITDAKGNWMLEWNQITNRKTNEVRQVSMPQDIANLAARGNEDTFIRKCASAFYSGEWSA